MFILDTQYNNSSTCIQNKKYHKQERNKAVALLHKLCIHKQLLSGTEETKYKISPYKICATYNEQVYMLFVNPLTLKPYSYITGCRRFFISLKFYFLLFKCCEYMLNCISIMRSSLRITENLDLSINIATPQLE